ncbi:DNA polymerase family A [Phage f2b1]|nr:DNA polymerase family A [Phage f2b1]
MVKVLFLQEYIRENHIKLEATGKITNVFFTQRAGQILKSLIESGLGLKRGDYYLDYAYGKVPKVVNRNNRGQAIKYKVPKLTGADGAKAEFELLYERIVKEKPDIIIPTGNLGCKALLGKSEVSKLRGVPHKITVETAQKAEQEQQEPTVHPDNADKVEEMKKRLAMTEESLEAFLGAYGDRLTTNSLNKEHAMLLHQIENLKQQIDMLGGGTTPASGDTTHECWVLPMYSVEYMLVDPNIQNLVEADFITLKKYVEQGERAFEASPTDYEHVTTIERVREIFTQEIPKAPIVSWDLETNTLKPELAGAKPLVISLCWEEGQGITIPLEHKEHTWLPGELAEIYNYIEAFVADENIVKVGHNIQYDIRFLRLTKGFKKFNNHRDTKVMYYLLINQNVEKSLRLSDMAYELTDMGGYDRALEVFKKDYLDQKLQEDKERIEQMKLEHKQYVAKLKAEHQLLMQQEKQIAKQEGRRPVITKLDIPKKTFPSATTPRNEVDGGNFNYEWIPLVSMLSPYASGDVDCCLRIHNHLDLLGQKPENAAIRVLYTNHYPQLTDTLAAIEANGVMMNTEYTQGLADAYEKEERRIVEVMRQYPEVKQLEEEILKLYQIGLEEFAKPVKDRDPDVVKLRNKYKDEEERIFNPNSSDQKKKVLFKYTGNKLPFNKTFLVDSAVDDNIPEEEIDWIHYKADKTALEYISEHFEETKELADWLLTHSLVKTRKQNFTYKLLAMVDAQGKLHGGFNPTGTETSRLSSSDPNLQQLPRKTGDVTRFDYQHPIKRMFVTSFPGGALLQLDYSSLESRILALAAEDDQMTQAFLNGDDIHKETASLVFGIPIDEVTDDQRSSAKSTTFGIAYGETPFSYYSKNGMTLEQAEKLFEDFFRNKPKIKAFIDATHEYVKKYGFVECMQGFRRSLRDIYSQDKSKVNGALRKSVNTRIQGTGAYLTNSSVILINKFIEAKGLRSKVVLTVHDSIVLDCPPEEVHLMAQVARHIMENLPIDWLFIDWKGEKIRYPIKADVEIGVNYNDMVGYDAEELNTFQNIAGYCKFHNDLKQVKNYKESKVIDKEKAEQLKAAIEERKSVYQTAM